MCCAFQCATTANRPPISVAGQPMRRHAGGTTGAAIGSNGETDGTARSAARRRHPPHAPWTHETTLATTPGLVNLTDRDTVRRVHRKIRHAHPINSRDRINPVNGTIRHDKTKPTGPSGGARKLPQMVDLTTAKPRQTVTINRAERIEKKNGRRNEKKNCAAKAAELRPLTPS